MYEKIIAFFTLLFLPLTQNANLTQNSVSAPAATFAFQELTIPYLRSREYKSNLGELDKL
jgi:hypothetical protein